MSDRPHLVTKILASLFLAAAAFWIGLADFSISEKWQQGQYARWLSLSSTGDALLAQSKLDDAYKAHREGLAIAEHLVASDRSDVKWASKLSLSHMKIGDVGAGEPRFCSQSLP